MQQKAEQPKSFGVAYKNYRSVAEFLDDYGDYLEDKEASTGLPVAALSDLQWMFLLVRLSEVWEETLKEDEKRFLRSLFEHTEALEEELPEYRVFRRKPDLTAWEAFPKEVRDACNAIPLCLELALKMDGKSRDEYTTVCYEYCAMIVYAFAACVAENPETRRHAAETLLKNWAERVAERNSHFRRADFSGDIAWMFVEEKPRREKADEAKQETAESLLEELNSLIGLSEAKRNVEEMIGMVRLNQRRKEMGMNTPPMSLHMVFSGNPGTGKTTVARLIAKIYHAIGVLRTDTFEEADASRLVAGYVGQTPMKVNELVDKAMGGMLFIDEAYSLTPNNGQGADFKKEAIDTLVARLENDRDDFVCIVAGYTDKMPAFLEANPGLQSRFNTFIHFDDYTPDEMFEILKKMCRDSGFVITPSCKQETQRIFEKYYEERTEKFANARDVRNYMERAIRNQSFRLSRKNPEELSELELKELIAEDVMNIVMGQAV